jgi:glycosyltransferase involved in cell wall biosynthesis
MSQAGRLLMVGYFLNRGICDELAARLAARGWEVSTTSTSTNRMGRIVDMLSTVARRRGSYDLAHVDVFSGQAFVWAEAVTLALARLRKPIVLTLHGGGLPAFGRRWPRRVRRLLSRAAIVTAPSRYLQDQMRVYRQDIRLLSNPVDLDIFAGRARAVVSPRLIWVRSFHRVYDPVGAVRVLAAIAREDDRATLTMIGPDKGDGSREDVLREADRLGVRHRLTLTGQMDRTAVADALASHDIFLNTTTVDNTPLSVIEALASGLCVVSTNVGGLPYLLRDNGDALLVAPGDVPGMAAAVHRLVQDAGVSARLSRAGLETADGFGWGRVLPQWEHLLMHVSAGVQHDVA